MITRFAIVPLQVTAPDKFSVIKLGGFFSSSDYGVCSSWRLKHPLCQPPDRRCRGIPRNVFHHVRTGQEPGFAGNPVARWSPPKTHSPIATPIGDKQSHLPMCRGRFHKFPALFLRCPAGRCVVLLHSPPYSSGGTRSSAHSARGYRRLSLGRSQRCRWIRARASQGIARDVHCSAWLGRIA